MHNYSVSHLYKVEKRNIIRTPKEIKKMAAPYSIDLREKIVLAYKNKKCSTLKLAKRFNVSKGFVISLLNRLKETGKVDPKPHGGGQHPAIDSEGEAFLKELLKKQPDLILEEIRIEYNKYFKRIVGRSTIDRTLKRMNVTRKKRLDGKTPRKIN